MSEESIELEELFLKTKPARALIAVSNPMTKSYAKQISKEIKSTYAHTVKILKRLEKADLIDRHDQGRKTIVESTERGKRVARAAQMLRAEVKDQSVQDEFHDPVFQAEEWNIVEADDELYIDCLGTETASVDLGELEKAVNQIQAQ
jgi:DNA-binding MarR family transcriptional regulator